MSRFLGPCQSHFGGHCEEHPFAGLNAVRGGEGMRRSNLPRGATKRLLRCARNDAMLTLTGPWPILGEQPQRHGVHREFYYTLCPLCLCGEDLYRPRHQSLRERGSMKLP